MDFSFLLVKTKEKMLWKHTKSYIAILTQWRRSTLPE